ncbi:hypothetical protein ABIB89_003183 [Bradyrhizobium sp. JR3.12]
MSLQSHWEEVVRLNGYDKLSTEDQEVLRNVYFTGAVAFYGLFMSGNNQLDVLSELKVYVDSKRPIIDNIVLPADLQGPANLSSN